MLAEQQQNMKMFSNLFRFRKLFSQNVDKNFENSYSALMRKLAHFINSSQQEQTNKS